MAQTPSSSTDREALIDALDRLIATGEPRHASHDDGELLQQAVDEAIRQGDEGIERLAVRAAAPIIGRIVRPIADEPPHLDIDASTVLTVPRPVPHDAEIFASLDGSEMKPAWQVRSGSRSGGSLAGVFPQSAGQPGFHRVRLQAQVTFRPAKGVAWTEIRDLPELAYGVYTDRPTTASDARAFLDSAGRVSAHDLDPELPQVPLRVWLARVLSRYATKSESVPMMWNVQYCDERTAELDLHPLTGDICAVAYFQIEATVGQVWIRTGHVQHSSSQVEWVLEPPVFHAVSLLRNHSTESLTLARLPALLESDPDTWPKGDVAIDPEDIFVTPAQPRPGTLTDIRVTVRNRGGADLHGVFVSVVFGPDTDHPASRRSFVVDIQAGASNDIALNGAFPSGYGFVMAHAMQLTEHSPFGFSTADAAPEDAAAFRAVNPWLAPPDYAARLRSQCGCRGW